tara:strand:+ start:16406 stop:17566 length:1161 start_codon:yes stop_codon:yes gene_type:complete
MVLVILFSFNVNAADAFKRHLVNIEEKNTYVPMVAGGTDANEKDYKFHARVMEFRDENKDIYFSCGGSILSDRYILTAAHCVNKNDKDLTYVMVKNMTENYTIKEFKAVKNIFIHEQWDLDYYEDGYDIAVLELEHPIYDNVQSITLPTTEDELYYMSIGSWWIHGRGSDENDKSSWVLKHAEARALSKTECEVERGDSYFEDGALCTDHLDFEEGVLSGLCGGDSGSALTYIDNNGKHQAIGIASYAPYPCDADGTSVFVDILYFKDWILSKMTVESNPMVYDETIVENQHSHGDVNPNPETDEDSDTGNNNGTVDEDNDSDTGDNNGTVDEDNDSDTGNNQDGNSQTDDDVEVVNPTNGGGSSGGSINFIFLGLLGLLAWTRKK